MISEPNMLFPSKIADNAPNIDLFSLCALVTTF